MSRIAKPAARPVVFLFASSLLLLPALSCSRQARVEVQTEAAKLLVSDEQMAELGEQVHRELESQGVRYVKDSVVAPYVEGIAKEIFATAEKDRPNIDWHVHVILDPKMVNAFATPGGHLYVTSGLLQAADTKTEVAGVMGHEVGHVTARHIERQLVTQYGMETVASLALGKDPSQLAQLATALAQKGALLSFSRADETEADEYAIRYSSQAGYDPRGIVQFFEKLKASQGDQAGPPVWLSTHPATQDRIQHAQKLIEQRGLTGGKEGREEQQEIKQRVERLHREAPAAPEPRKSASTPRASSATIGADC